MPCPVDPGRCGSDLLLGSGSSRCCRYCCTIAAAGGSSIGLPAIGSRILASDSALGSDLGSVRSPAHASAVAGSYLLPGSGSSPGESTC